MTAARWERPYPVELKLVYRHPGSGYAFYVVHPGGWWEWSDPKDGVPRLTICPAIDGAPELIEVPASALSAVHVSRDG